VSSRFLQWIFGFCAFVLVATGLWFDWLKWFFVCEVQCGAALFLVALPILALTSDRALLLGAYDIRQKDRGRHFGFVLMIAVASIVWTAQAELGLAELRMQQALGPKTILYLIGIVSLLAALVLNLVVTHKVSVDTGAAGGKKFSWQAIDSQMLQGVGLGILCLVFGELVIWSFSLLPSAPLLPPFADWVRETQANLRLWLPKQLWAGYIGEHGEFAIVGSHVSFLILLLLSGFFYVGGRKLKLPPICCLALLTVVLVWLLSGFAFFFQAFRIPTLLPVLVWLWLSSRHPKADHFYEVLADDIQTAPNLNFLESTPDEPGIVVVAAAGGGIQASAWTAQVLAGLNDAASANEPYPFESALRAVSGVSGGSVGLMYYLAAQASGTKMTAAPEAALKSSLSEVTDALAYDDVQRAFFPFSIHDIYKDRGAALEQAWIKNGLRSGGGAYGLRRPQKEGCRLSY
jgi:hypothetical protein